MNISKYIELLRFYVTDKITQINQSVQDAFSSEVDEVLSSILSAIFSFYISLELVKENGPWGIILKVAIVIVSYFSLKFVIKKVRRYQKSNKEQRAADESNITEDDAKSLVDRFDHIACDGMLLSREYLKKYKKTENIETDNERWFYLFEAFYYYKKALQIVTLVVQYNKSCFNNAHNINGISMYRFINVYNSLVEIKEELNKNIENAGNIEYHHEFNNDMLATLEILDKIKNYIQAKQE